MEDQDQLQKIFIPYTYTYDQFTVFFYGDRVFVGEKLFWSGETNLQVSGVRDQI